MGITDLIRPKWKHSDPTVRLKAVQQMNPVKEAERLQEIAAADPDAGVKMAAIARIADETFLTDMAARSNGDTAVSEAARTRLNAIYRESIFNITDARTCKALLEKLDDENILAEIACETDDPHIRLAATARIIAPALLCEITESNCGLKAGMAIVERLSDPEHLKRISHHATNKKVKKQARQKLDAILAEINKPSPEEQLAADLEALCGRLEDLAVSQNPEVIASALSDARSAWDRLDPGQDHSLCGRFREAVASLEAQSERLRQEAETARTKRESEALCIRAERLNAAMPDDAEDQMRDIQTQWDAVAAARLPRAQAEALQKRFENACHLFEQNRKAQIRAEAERQRKLRVLADYCDQAEALPQSGDWEKAETHRNQLRDEWAEAFFDDPGSRSLTKRFEAALTACEEHQKAVEAEREAIQNAQKKKLLALCETVETAAEAEERSGLDQTVRAAQKEWKETGEQMVAAKEELTPRFREACDRFFARQREYWENVEWERWANLNQKQEICDIAERIAGGEETEGIVPVIREAQKKWKEIGPVPREKADEVWDRFNDACDRVYQRCLRRKTEICEQVKALIAPQEGATEAVSPEFNWTETAKALRSLQARWNAIGALPLALEKELRQDFRTTCDAFFDNLRTFYQQRDAERTSNLELKTGLCEEAEALAGSEDWNETATRLKALQRRWKSIGPVPRHESDAVWSRFRSACDTFFERLKAQEPENLRRKEALCVQAEALAAAVTDDTDMEKTGHELMDLQRQWKEIGPVPADEAEALWQRFQAPCDRFFARRKTYLRERESEQADNQARKEALIVQAEALSDSTDWKETGERLKDIQQQWKAIGPAGHKAEQELWPRFRGACDVFFTRRNHFYRDLDKQRQDNLRQKEQLCLSLEALARLVLPEEVLGDGGGQTEQAARQLRIALDYKNEIIVPGNKKETWGRVIRKVRAIRKQWKTIGPVPSENDEALWRRYRSAADLFFTSRPLSEANEENDLRKEDKE